MTTTPDTERRECPLCAPCGKGCTSECTDPTGGRRDRIAAAMYATSPDASQIPWEHVPQSFREPWRKRADAAIAADQVRAAEVRAAAYTTAADTVADLIADGEDDLAVFVNELRRLAAAARPDNTPGA